MFDVPLRRSPSAFTDNGASHEIRSQRSMILSCRTSESRNKRRRWRLRGYLMNVLLTHTAIFQSIHGLVGVHCFDTIVDVNDQHALNVRSLLLIPVLPASAALHPPSTPISERTTAGCQSGITIVSLSWSQDCNPEEAQTGSTGYRSAVSKRI